MNTAVGLQIPKQRNVPDFAISRADKAVQLAAIAKLRMDPWQSNYLHDSLGVRPDGKWCAFECGLIVSRQNGKGSVLEARVLAGMLLFGERLILWSAHETKTAFEAFRRCEDMFRADPELFKHVKTIHRSNGSEGIELHNGARLRFVARSKGSGRGFSADLIILDEAYALSSDQLAALIPTLATRPNPQIWYTSSPPLDGESGDQLYALRKRALAGDPGLCWYDWGVPDVDLEMLDSIDLADRALWYMTNPARTHAGIVMVGQLADGRYLWELIDYRDGPPDWAVARLAQLRDRWSPLAFALDDKGPAGSLLMELADVGIRPPADRDNPRRGDLAVPTAQQAAQAFGLAVDAIRQREVAHQDQKALTAAVLGAQTRPLAGGLAWNRKAGVDIVPVVAGTVGQWAYMQRLHLARGKDYDLLRSVY
jgi:hypothetical protein